MSGPRTFLIALLGAGAALRIMHFAELRPLWFDEAMLALNIGARDAAGLLSSLDYNQAAPPLYLLLLKGGVTLFGMHEWVLRLPSLVAGIVLPWLVWLVARRSMSTAGALAAVAVAAAAPLLVGYSAVAKSYQIGACATAILSWLALRVVERDTARRRAALGLAGVVCLGFSLPAAFVLGGIGCTLLFVAWRGKNSSLAVSTMVWGAVWLAVVFAVREMASSDDIAASMHEVWAWAMIRVGEPQWAGRVFLAMREGVLATIDPDRRLPELLALIIAAGGTAVFFRRHGLTTAALLALPLSLALLGSALSLWPVFGRLSIFLAPFAFWWLGALFGEAFGDGRRHVAIKLAALAALVFLIVPGVGRPSGPAVEESRALVAELSSRRENAPVYLFESALPAWVFYSTDWRDPDMPRLAWYARDARAQNSSVRHEPFLEDEPGVAWDGASGSELVARRTGTVVFDASGFPSADLEPNWGSSEARRIRDASDTVAWVFGAHMRQAVADSLRAGISAAGGTIVNEWDGPAALLWELRWR